MERRARNPITGELYTVSADMDYSKWYDTYVKDNPEAEAAQKIIRNKSADKKKYDTYVKNFDKNMKTQTFEEFQKSLYQVKKTINISADTDITDKKYLKGTSIYSPIRERKRKLDDKQYICAAIANKSGRFMTTLWITSVKRADYPRISSNRFF